MKLPRRRFLHLAASAAALPAASGFAWAQTYPARPVRVIVPFAPGGTVDVFARVTTQKLSEQLGKQFFVENIAGATGNLGTGQAARAAPDGYTVLFAFSSHVVNPSLFARVPYDPVKDFEPVTLAVASTHVLTVNPSVPAKTVEELVTLVRANPGKYNFASGAPARRPISWANSSDCRSASTSSTCPSTAQALRSPRWWPATPRSASARWRRPRRRSREGKCVPSR